MSITTGIQISKNNLRLVCLENKKNTYHLLGLVERHLSDTSITPSILDADTLCKELGQALKNLPAPLDKLAFSLPGGLYHIQKIPLEVASEDDRRDQIAWEASQALIAPPKDYVIDFVPAGRVAFWTAVRKRIIDLLTTVSETIGARATHITIEPIALFHAGLQANAWGPGRQTVVHLDSPWSSFVSVENGTLIAAETVRANDTATQLSSSQIQRIRQWVSGDLAGSPRRPQYRQVYLSGQAVDISAADINLSPEIAPTEYPAFAGLETNQLPEQTDQDHPGKYAIAVGAAIHSLSQNGNR
jgi:hypothetical protein